MTYKRLPANLPDLLRKAGLKVVVLDGWRTRGRPGEFNPRGVLWHHTGSFDGIGDAANDKTYARWLGVVGRSDLPAPLSQLSISAEGVVYVLASGRANHAGKAKKSGPIPAGDGNAMLVGVECMNSGSQGWSKAQYNAMVKTGVVLGRVLGRSSSYQRGHKETSVTGKWDPGKLDMAKFRRDLAAASAKPKPPVAAKPKPKPVPAKPVVRAISPSQTYVVTAPALHGRKDPRLSGARVGRTRKKGETFLGNALSTDPASKRTFIRETGSDLWYDALHLDLVGGVDAKHPARPLDPARPYVVTAAKLHGRKHPKIAGSKVLRTDKKGHTFWGNAAAVDPVSKRTFIRDHATGAWYDAMHLDLVQK